MESIFPVCTCCGMFVTKESECNGIICVGSTACQCHIVPFEQGALAMSSHAMMEQVKESYSVLGKIPSYPGLFSEKVVQLIQLLTRLKKLKEKKIGECW